MRVKATLDLSDKKVRFVGDNSLLILGDGDIIIRNSTVVFDGVSLRAPQPFRQAFYVVGSGSSVVVRNASVENLDQVLDGITWINVEFRHSMIKVQNGPFTLVNVTFTDCDLRWLQFNQLGLELSERIRQANGHAFSFGYTGTPPPTTPKAE